MPSATGTGGGGAGRRRLRRTSRAPRAARTLVAVLGVSCIALTAAFADPSGLAPQAPSDVFAAGEGGLGRLDTGGGPTTQRPDGPTAGSAGTLASSLPDADLEGLDEYGDPFSDPFADELDALGGEYLASAVPSGLATGDIPAATLRAYRSAAQVLAREQPACGIDWALIAGIGRVESNHGRYGGATVTADGRSVPGVLGVRLDGSLAGTMVIRDTDGGALDGDTQFDRALGPMQFLPGTWQRWGSDGDRDGVEDPQDIDDAALAAARYLCSGDGGLDQPGPAAAAVRRYNNSTEYVQLVLATAASYRDGGPSAFPDAGYGDATYDEPYYPTADGYPGPAGWSPPPSSAVGGRPGAGTPGPVFTPGTGATPGPSRTDRPLPTPSATVTQPPTASPTRPPTKPATTVRPTPKPTPTPPPSSGPTSPSTPSPSPTQPTDPPTTAEPSPEPSEPSAEPSEPTTEPSEPPATCEPVPTDGESPPPSTDPEGAPCLPPCTEPDPSPTDAEPAADCDPEPGTEPSGTPTTPPGD